MPKFRMTYPYARNFQGLGKVEPDEVIERDENPSPHFFEEVAEAKPWVAPEPQTTEETD